VNGGPREDKNGSNSAYLNNLKLARANRKASKLKIFITSISSRNGDLRKPSSSGLEKTPRAPSRKPTTRV
jgi:hypothetical protein